MNYHGKKFIAVTNTANGESSSSTIFHYQQAGTLLTAEYSGGEIEKGYILGKVDAKGHIDMVYQHVNIKGEIRTGKCLSIPYITESGNLRLKESWQWTNGDLSHGSSEIEEI